MPCPRQKLGRRWKRNRRSHDALKTRPLSRCQRCNQPKMPHRICPNCGYYKQDEMVIDMKKI